MALFPPPLGEQLVKYDKEREMIIVSHRWVEWFRLLSDRLGVETSQGASGNLAEFDADLNLQDSNFYVNDSETTSNNLWSASKIVATAGGDVVGPASSTNNAVARYDTTTGKLLQNSGVIISDTNNVTGIVALTTTGAIQGTNINATGNFRVDGTQVVSNQATAEADASAPTGYTPHASGGVTVTSNAATDLDTTAAALDTLVSEVDTLTTKVNNVLAKLRTHGLIAT